MSRDTSEEQNFNVEKRREESRAYIKRVKIVQIKTITLVQVYINIFSSLSPGSKNSNRDLDAVISSKLLNKVK